MSNDVRTIKHILITVVAVAALYFIVTAWQADSHRADKAIHCSQYPYATDCR